MEIKNLAIISLMIIFLIMLVTKVEAATGTINEETVKLRKAPDSKTVLDLLDEGDKVEILEKEDGWYKVKATTELGKVTGYISEELIDVEGEITSEIENEPTQPETTPVESKPIETTPVVSTQTEKIEENNQYTLNQEISVKTLPLINSREKSKINGNVKVIEIINDWARIETELEIGWVRIKMLQKSISKIEVPVQPEEKPQEEQVKKEPAPELTEPEEKVPEVSKPEVTEMNKIGYVSTDGLRVRKGPSTDTEEITSLSKNAKVEIIGKSGNWYKINLKGEIGYISAKYISDTKIPETTSRDGSTLRNENLIEPNVEDTKTVTEETPKVETTPEEKAPSTKGAEVVEYAKKYLGYKYVSGGASPAKGFDCSGFTTYVYKNFGVSLNRTSGGQSNNGVAVSKDDLQPGDLVLFNNDANTKIGHVGIYIGDGNFIHASNPSDGVKITTLLSGYYKTRYVGARRVI